ARRIPPNSLGIADRAQARAESRQRRRIALGAEPVSAVRRPLRWGRKIGTGASAALLRLLLPRQDPFAAEPMEESGAETDERSLPGGPVRPNLGPGGAGRLRLPVDDDQGLPPRCDGADGHGPERVDDHRPLHDLE